MIFGFVIERCRYIRFVSDILIGAQYVSEVVIGAPYTMNMELMDHFKIDIVCHGCTSVMPDVDGRDPYEVRVKSSFGFP